MLFYVRKDLAAGTLSAPSGAAAASFPKAIGAAAIAVSDDDDDDTGASAPRKVRAAAAAAMDVDGDGAGPADDSEDPSAPMSV